MTRPIPLENTTSHVGGKAANLRWLQAQGFRVPPTWVLPSATSGPDDMTEHIGRNVEYAVRSSADVEDGVARSFAGQFESVLAVPSTAHRLEEAIQTVRDSVEGSTVTAYAGGIPASEIAMAVIIQEMVTPVVSGVAFSKNPVTGMSETVIEALRGRGDLLVSGGATPWRWVKRWGDWIEQPAASDIETSTIEAVAQVLGRVAGEFGQPCDIEWVWNGEEVVLVQVRPITGLDGIAIYSNRISKEVMPGLIKPLVWSVNVPVVNQAWIDLFTEVLGPNQLTSDDLARQFGYRSYFNMGTIGDIFELMGMPRESLESLLGLPKGTDQPRFKPSTTTYRKTPKLLLLALRKARYGRVADREVPELRAAYAAYDRPLGTDSDEQLLDAIDELMALGSRAAYVNIVVPLLANLYTALLRRRLAGKDIDLSEIDLTAGVSGFEDHDPNPHLDRLAELIASHEYPGELAEAPAELREALDRFLAQFGHFSDSGNDFSVAPWREHPELVYRVASARTVGRGRSARMQWSEVETRIGVVARRTAGTLKRRASDFQLRREAISSTYTYGYGLFRNYFLEIGRRLVERDILDDAEDVMLLSLDEVRGAILGQEIDARGVARHHARELRRVSDLEMPEIIYGDDFVPVRPGNADGARRGVATSRGHYEGRLRVVTGIADFDKVSDGDVLAIPFSDVGWTPLFAKAGAVVAESGGMLSHSSIVAREYGIPCVVSVPGATRLPDGARVSVDGYRGEVIVQSEG